MHCIRGQADQLPRLALIFVRCALFVFLLLLFFFCTLFGVVVVFLSVSLLFFLLLVQVVVVVCKSSLTFHFLLKANGIVRAVTGQQDRMLRDN